MIDSNTAYEALMLKAAQDEAFRESLLKDPRGTLEAFLGTQLPEGFKVNVVSNTATELTLVIPPKLSEELSDEALDAVAGGGKFVEVAFSIITAGLGCIISAAKSSIGECQMRNPRGERRPMLP